MSFGTICLFCRCYIAHAQCTCTYPLPSEDGRRPAEGRWLALGGTSNSGKIMFTCRVCGRESVTPDKVCSGSGRACAEEYRPRPDPVGYGGTGNMPRPPGW